MKIRTLIIDDEPIALEKLRTYVAKEPFLELVGQCSSGLDAMEVLNAGGADLIITDINMPDLSGLDLIRSLADPPMIILTTAYPDYAIEGYKVSALDYLLKPYGFAEFHGAVTKARDRFASTRRPASATGGSLFVKTDYRYVRVNLDEIRYIKGYGEYLQIFLTSAPAPLMTLSSFAAIRERLTDNFLQIHRSYIVNMDHVSQIERARIVMDAETFIPVGDSYKAAFQQYLQSNAIGKK